MNLKSNNKIRLGNQVSQLHTPNNLLLIVRHIICSTWKKDRLHNKNVIDIAVSRIDKTMQHFTWNVAKGKPKTKQQMKNQNKLTTHKTENNRYMDIKLSKNNGIFYSTESKYTD